MDRKLVVLGIPWDIDTDGLKEYMSKYGELEDCIVMKERSSGRSRGFGYVTFLSEEDAKHVLTVEHSLGNRMLEVKVATPKEEMRVPSKKVTRIFVARIPQSVTKSTFQSHFEKYGEITDLYMPKDQGSASHRGIGFITYAKSESVDNLMSESHELGGSAVVVDRATPKEEEGKGMGMGMGGRERERVLPHQHLPHQQGGGYGAYNAYITAATRYAALGAPTMYDHPPPPLYAPPRGKKIFVGRLPQEATIEALRQYFGRFGRILDVYLPRDPKRSGHRGFGFVTFADDRVADRVSRRSHEICGHQVAIDTATPVDDGGGGNEYTQQQAGPMRPYVGAARMNLDFDDWNYGIGSARPSRSEWRYRPY